jgi:hypothetical protein
MADLSVGEMLSVGAPAAEAAIATMRARGETTSRPNLARDTNLRICNLHEKGSQFVDRSPRVLATIRGRR